MCVVTSLTILFEIHLAKDLKMMKAMVSNLYFTVNRNLFQFLSTQFSFLAILLTN